jgi:hypothetical protein
MRKVSRVYNLLTYATRLLGTLLKILMIIKIFKLILYSKYYILFFLISYIIAIFGNRIYFYYFLIRKK